MKRTIKIKANCLNKEDEILLIGTIQRNIKNYVWSRYSGIGSLLKQSGWTIRDELVQKNLLSNKIPKTFSRAAIEKSASIIKTNWITTKKKVKQAIAQNENLTKADRHYLFLCLKHTPTLYNILNYKKVDYAIDYLKDLKVDVHRLNNLLRRYIRRYKTKSYTNKANIILTPSLYKFDLNNNTFSFAGKKKNSRIVITLIGNVPKSNSILELVKNQKSNQYYLHVPLDRIISKKEMTAESEILGLDVGMTDLITLSNGSVYGANSAELFYTLSDNLVNKNRSRLFAHKQKIEQRILEEQDDAKKSLLELKLKNLEENNLGSKKRISKISKYKSRIASHINCELNKMVKEEDLKEIVREDLNWSSKKSKKKNKRNVSRKQQNRFSTWTKGVLLERLSVKLAEKGIKETIVNPAYTSQVCCKCNHLGDRKGKEFKCSNCNLSIDADFNASINIKKRKFIKEINIDTPYKEVKKYYENLSV
jgi:transposase, IS605 orfB family protein (fragment)